MQQEEGLRKRAKRKACFNVLQQVQPRLAESNCHFSDGGDKKQSLFGKRGNADERCLRRLNL